MFITPLKIQKRSYVSRNKHSKRRPVSKIPLPNTYPNCVVARCIYQSVGRHKGIAKNINRTCVSINVCELEKAKRCRQLNIADFRLIGPCRQQADENQCLPGEPRYELGETVQFVKCTPAAQTADRISPQEPKPDKESIEEPHRNARRIEYRTPRGEMRQP